MEGSSGVAAEKTAEKLVEEQSKEQVLRVLSFQTGKIQSMFGAFWELFWLTLHFRWFSLYSFV